MADGTPKSTEDNRYLEWFKFLVGGSVAVTLLIAYGFLSESAAFQYLGLPQLQANAIEMAEQGGRNFIDSFAALGVARGVVLLGIATGVALLWWNRGREPWARYLLSVKLLKWMQILVLPALFVLMFSLVDVRILGLSSAHSDQAERERMLRAELREDCASWLADLGLADCEISAWDPRQEFARVEALDFEVGPVRWLCDELPNLPWPCFTHRDYRAVGSDGSGSVAAAEFQLQQSTNRLGISKRKTQAARRAAREAFGGLFLTTLLASLAVYLLIAWRRWLEQAIGTGQALQHVQGTSWWVGEHEHEAFYQSARRYTEPVLAIVLAISLGLLPSAYGVLAKGSVGTQEVVVRLRTRADPESEELRECAGLGLMLQNKASALGTPDVSSAKQSAQAPNNEAGDQAPRAPIDSSDRTFALHSTGDDWRSHLLTCDESELNLFVQDAAGASGQEKKSLLAGYQQAWRDFLQLRPQERDDYLEARNALYRATDQVIQFLGNQACPAAFAAFWQALPGEGHFSTRPQEAQYVWERWTELQRTRSVTRFGVLVNYPRGSHENQLLLADLLSRPTAKEPIRVSMVPIPLACALSIEPLPDLESEAIDGAVNRLFAAPADSGPIGVLETRAGEKALAAMLRVYQSGVLPKAQSGVLVTQIGTQAGLLRVANPLLHAEAVDTLAAVIRQGLEVMASASATGTLPASADDKAPDERSRLAADAASAATGLHLAAGPWAGIQLARAACSSLHGQPQAPAFDCRLRQELLEASKRLDPALLNRLGTLVTAAGFLASDLQQELRATPARVHDLSPKEPPACEAHRGDPYRNTCRNGFVFARAALDGLLAAVAQDHVVTGAQVRHSVANRRAACTALGLSGSEAAAQALEAVIPELLTSRDELLIGSCLVQSPANMSAGLRSTLRTLVLGQWPERVAGEVGLADDPAIPSLLVRRTALGELYEAGLFFEDELMHEVLHADLPAMRSEAAKFLEDVAPDAMGERLWQCAYPESAGDDRAGTAERTERQLRCLRALPLLATAEDGDSGLTRRVAGRLVRSTEAEETEALCWALGEFAARRGRDAISVWPTTRRPESITDEADGGQASRCLSYTDIERQREAPARDRWRANLNRFDQLEGTAKLAAIDGIDARRDPVDPGGEEIAALQRRVLSGDLTSRTLAFAQLSTISFEAAGSIALEPFLERPATMLVLLAAGVLEDAAALTVAPGLITCASDENTSIHRRARCLLGLALTRADYVPIGSDRDTLRALRDQSALRQPLCRLSAEFSARSSDAALIDCGQDAPALPADPRDRWRSHLDTLRALLATDRTANGPFQDESRELHREQLMMLSDINPNP